MMPPPHVAEVAMRLALATDLAGHDPTPAQVRAFASVAGCAPDVMAACLGRRYGRARGHVGNPTVVGPYHPTHNAHLIPVSPRAQEILAEFWRAA